MGKSKSQGSTASRPPRVDGGKTKPSKGFSKWLVPLLLAVVVAAAAFVLNFFFGTPAQLVKLTPIPTLPYGKSTWGTYRSHTYFGLRTRAPDSPLFGVAWYIQPAEAYRPNMRHWCDQGDGFSFYAWTAADARTFGTQELRSPLDGNISVSWLNKGDSWTAKLKFRGPQEDSRYVILLYLATPESEPSLKVSPQSPAYLIEGKHPLFGQFRLSLRSDEELAFSSIGLENVDLSKFTDIILSHTRAQKTPRGLEYRLEEDEEFKKRAYSTAARFAAVQINAPRTTELEISFQTEANVPPQDEEFKVELEKRVQSWKKKVREHFALQKFSTIEQKMGEVALANMLGAVGYSFGSNRVRLAGEKQQRFYGPHELFTGVPSRPFFPRGFLWDEGFHNLLIQLVDTDLSLEILVSWLNTMNQEGWMPREQILGVEAEARVPAEFIEQRPDVANPPSMFYLVDQLLGNEKLFSDPTRKALLEGAYKKLSIWYKWLHRTQSGPKEGTFRWRGRNGTTELELNPKTLPSGLDDFPRASHPTNEEYHVDLRCWMALSSRVIAKMAALFDTPETAKKLEEEARHLANFDNLVKLHWSTKTKSFTDYGLHSTKVELKKTRDSRTGEIHAKRHVASKPQLRLVEDTFGYTSLFPLIMHLLPADSPQLAATLEKISDPEEIWTPFGLRSVSKKSPYYGAWNTQHDGPYWRGAIWINLNYLAADALRYYAKQPGPQRERSLEIYRSLRAAIVGNIAKQFNETGFIWEHYDDETGKGKGSHPFNGWSSLVLLLMTDE